MISTDEELQRQDEILEWLKDKFPTTEDMQKQCKSAAKKLETELKTELKGITLFSGMGGSALGMQLAGIKDVFFNDYEGHAIKCLSESFKGLPNDECYCQKSIISDLKHPKSILSGPDPKDADYLTGDYIKEKANVKEGEIFMMQMSPPCQDLSRLKNKKFVNKNNWYMYREGLRIAKTLKPKTIVMENVPGFKNNLKLLTDALIDFKELGYVTSFGNLESQFYKSSQARKRFWIIAYHKDFGIKPSFVQPQNGYIPPTIKSVCTDVNYFHNSQFGGTIMSSDRPMPTITKNPSLFFFRDKYLSEADKEKIVILMKDLKWMYLDDNTSVNKMIKYLPQRNELIKEGELNYEFPYLQELLAFSDFPPDWTLAGDKFKEKWNRIGNMVLPNMMKAICETVIQDFKNAKVI